MANDRHSVGSCKNPDLQTFATGGEPSPLLPEALHFGVVVVVVHARGDERVPSAGGQIEHGCLRRAGHVNVDVHRGEPMVVYSMSSAETVSRIKHRFSNETRHALVGTLRATIV